MRVLVVDVGGNNLKISRGGAKEPIKVPSGSAMTPAMMVKAVKKATPGWGYSAVSIGYPGPVRDGRPTHDPKNLGPGWVKFDFRRAFGCPVKVMNDAAMQALGSYRGGRMLFLGLGTGLGSALVANGVVMPLELAHVPYRKGRTYEDYAGERGLKRLGPKRWTKHVHKIVEILKHGLQADYVVLGGGQTKQLASLPPAVRVGGNENAIAGGLRMWEERRRARGARPSDRLVLGKRPRPPRARVALDAPPPPEAPAPSDDAAGGSENA
jgi:predicted NBD/HSP70 family sugar kinase